MPLTTRTVAYADRETPLTGELYWDTDDVPRPGILLIHGAEVSTTMPAGRPAGTRPLVTSSSPVTCSVTGSRATVGG